MKCKKGVSSSVYRFAAFDEYPENIEIMNMDSHEKEHLEQIEKIIKSSLECGIEKDRCIGRIKSYLRKLDELSDIRFKEAKLIGRINELIGNNEQDALDTLGQITSFAKVSPEQRGKAGSRIKDIKRLISLSDDLSSLRSQENCIIDDINELVDKYDVLENRPIGILHLSTDTENLLHYGYQLLCGDRYLRDYRRICVDTIGDILEIPEYFWRKIAGINKAMAKEIEEKMHEIGFTDFKINLGLGRIFPFLLPKPPSF